MPLTNLAIQRAKPRAQPYKLFDTKGLFLLVEPRGSKLWRFKYRFGGKEKLISFGPYPEVTQRWSCRLQLHRAGTEE